MGLTIQFESHRGELAHIIDFLELLKLAWLNYGYLVLVLSCISFLSEETGQVVQNLLQVTSELTDSL